MTQNKKSQTVINQVQNQTGGTNTEQDNDRKYNQTYLYST